MMTENHPAIRRHEIFAVILHHRRRRTLIVEDEHFRRDPFAVEAITDCRRAKSRCDNPERADLLAPRQRQHRERCQPNQRHRNPEKFFPERHSPSKIATYSTGRTGCCRACAPQIRASVSPLSAYLSAPRRSLCAADVLQRLVSARDQQTICWSAWIQPCAAPLRLSQSLCRAVRAQQCDRLRLATKFRRASWPRLASPR